MAKSGLRFTQSYNSTRCWPSRAALLSGYYPQQILRDKLPGVAGGLRQPWARLLPDYLKPAGYRSYHSGKWHIDGKVLDGGFDRSLNVASPGNHFTARGSSLDDVPVKPPADEKGYYLTIATTDHAIGCLKDHAANHAKTPFFQYIALHAPHFPLHALPEDIAKYRELENACRKPGEWQVFDIRYRAPRRDDAGKITEKGTVTVWFNGKKVQDNTEFGELKSTFHPFRFGNTPYLDKIRDQLKKTATGPVFLQDHGNPVKFRNVWVLPADDRAFVYEPETRDDDGAMPTEELLAKAQRYRDGKGVARDYADAMDFVGWMYIRGLGVKQNPEVAAGYFRAAAGKSAAAA